MNKLSAIKMKNVKLILAVFICLKLNAQNSVAYSYDANGNRDSRYFVGLRMMNLDLGADSGKVMQKQVDLAMEYGVSVYPNPTRDFINVNMNNSGKDPVELGKTELILIDNSGRVIAKKKYTDQTAFDMSICSPGVYHLNISFNKKQQLGYRIVKVN